MKKIIITICFLLICNAAIAKTYAVRSNNQGNIGDILINDGVKKNKRTTGNWIDSSSFKGNKGEQGIKGNDGNIGGKGDAGRGLKNRHEIQGEIRISDTRKTSTSIYGIHDFNNNIQTIGIKFVWKLGKSFGEKKLEELEERLKELEK